MNIAHATQVIPTDMLKPLAQSRRARPWFSVLIGWTYCVGGLAPALPHLQRIPGLGQVPYLYLSLVLVLPAAVLGTLLYLAAPRSVRVIPVLAIVVLMIAGFLWTYPTERGRGLVEMALVATPIPLAVLIQKRSTWLLAVKSFLIASVVATGYLFVDWLGQGARTGLDVGRFGGLYDRDVARVMEPNITATHLGFGVLLIAICWLAPFGYVDRRSRLLATACLPVLLTGVLLTGSRGGVFSLYGAASVLFVFTSVRRSLSLRTNALGVAGLAILAWLLLFAPTPVSDRIAHGDSRVADGAEAASAISRIAGLEPEDGNTTKSKPVMASSTGSFGGRVDIWKAAITASESNTRALMIGFGTGGADHAIGMANPDLPVSKIGEHGVRRANAHNTYLYWLVSYGVIGMIVAGGALTVIAWYALGNDWRQNWGAGVAMLAFFLLTSVTLIANRLEVTSIAISALTLGYILPRSDCNSPDSAPRAFWGRLPWV